ncbi:MAG: hypothetical protein COA79_08795 [Planctomycetota bacterium]|nr:MAG: hypothetical protein COA79_08795 [Planctomycetota bacterium]
MNQSFKSLALISLIIFLLLQTSCRYPRDRIGGRISIDGDTGQETPLNKEACLILSYQALCKGNLKESMRFIELSNKLKSDRIIIKEGLKTLHALTLLKQNEFAKALELIKAIAPIKSYKTIPSHSKDLIHSPILEIRDAARKLKKCQIILAEYVQLKSKKKLSNFQFKLLTKKWKVTLTSMLPSNTTAIEFPLQKIKS